MCLPDLPMFSLGTVGFKCCFESVCCVLMFIYSLPNLSILGLYTVLKVSFTMHACLVYPLPNLGTLGLSTVLKVSSFTVSYCSS